MPSLIDFSKPVYGTPTTQSVRDNFQIAQNEITSLQQLISTGPFLPLNGGIMTGKLELWRDPVANHEAATKQYVDAIAFAGGGMPDAPKNGFYYVRGGGETTLATENEWIIDPIFNSMKIWDANRVLMFGLHYDATFNYYEFGMNNSFFRFGRTSNVLELFINSIGVAGYSSSAITFNSKVLPSNGISFGSLTSTSPTDFSKHIEFYTNFAGMSITGGRLNLNCNGSMVFLSGGVDLAFFDLSQGGLIFNSGATIKLSQDPTTGLHAATKQYVDSVRSLVTGSYLPLVGGALTGNLFLNQTNSEAMLTLNESTANGFARIRYQTATLRWVAGITLGTGNFSIGDEVAGAYRIEMDAVGNIGLNGSVSLLNNPTAPLHAATKQYVDTKAGQYLPLTGGTVNGQVFIGQVPNYFLGITGGGSTTPGFISFHDNAGNRIGYVGYGLTNRLVLASEGGYTGWNVTGEFVINGYLNAGGGAILQGNVTLTQDPTSALAVATKQYVDGKIGGAGYLPLTGGNLTGPLGILVNDGVLGLLVTGATKGIRFTGNSNNFSIEGVDNTGVGSYQPLHIGGSTVSFTAPTIFNSSLSIATGQPLFLGQEPTTAAHAVTKTYADTKLSLTGGSLNGDLGVLHWINIGNGTVRSGLNINMLSASSGGISFLSNNSNRWMVALDAYPESGLNDGGNLAFYVYNNDGSFGGTPFGISRFDKKMYSEATLQVARDPTTALEVATKQYVDGKVGGVGYLPLTGGKLTGRLNVDTIAAVVWPMVFEANGGPIPASTFGTAIGFNAINGGWGAADFVNLYPSAYGSFQFHQLTATAGVVNTLATIYATGVIEVTSALLKRDPTTALEAATKQYADTKLSKSGGVITGPTTIQGDLIVSPGSLSVTYGLTFGFNGADYSAVYMNAKPNTNRITYYQSNGSTRWLYGTAAGAESGGNVGSDFFLSSYTDAGASGATALYFSRATGLGFVAGDPTAPMGIATKQYADTKLSLSGGTVNGNLTVTGSINASSGIVKAISLNNWASFELSKSASGQQNQILASTNNVLRWMVALGDTTAETGANAGSDFAIHRYDDAGNYLGRPFFIQRSNGSTVIDGGLTINGSIVANGIGLSGTTSVYQMTAGTFLTISGQTVFSASANIILNGGGRPTYSHEFYWGATRHMMMGQDNSLYLVYGTGLKPGGGAWADSSDSRIKNVTGDYTLGLNEILNLNPIRYTFKGNDKHVADQQLYHPDTTKEYIGLSAQEVEPYFPEMVTRKEGLIDEIQVDDLRVLDLSSLPLALVNAVKELYARIVTIETQLATRS